MTMEQSIRLESEGIHAPPIGSQEYSAALQGFMQRFPQYSQSDRLDRLREQEFSRLDQQNHIYLDYTGGSLYSEKLLKQHTAQLESLLLGNPHSFNRASQKATDLVEEARLHVLNYFNADPDQYCAIFTANSSQALKLVGESFPFKKGSRLLLSYDNHNSVQGLRCYAQRQEASVEYVEIDSHSLQHQNELVLNALLDQPTETSLFVYPAQSNYSGVKHPLDWLATAKENQWLSFLDIAAYVPTNDFDMSQYQPDFACLSFYKMFGYPTGIGCLLAKKSALKQLVRPWFSGGSVMGVSVMAEDHLMAYGEAAFEDGTVNYAGIPAVSNGLNWLKNIGMESISTRLHCLSAWLLEQLQGLQHHNGKKLVRHYGPTDVKNRGATFAINLLDCQGIAWEPRAIESLANRHGISIRAGYHCNPGVNETALKSCPTQLKGMYAQKDQISLEEFLWLQEENLNGVARVSLGVVSNFKDVYVLVEFLKTFLNQTHNN